ncbi:hypothetical protein, partial [Saccharicrinis fermentans]
LPVKKTGKTFEGYTEVEIDNLEVVVMDRYKELPTIYDDASKIYTFSNESNSVDNAERLNEFNKVVGDIAQMGDNVWLKEQLQGKQRRVIYQNPNKGQIFWVKNEDLEEKTLTFSIQTTASNKVATAQTAPAVANGVSQDGLANGTGTSEVVVPEAQANSATTTETKIYLRLNKELSEVYLISPEDDNINTKIEADVIVNIKEGKVYKDKDEKEWYLLEPIGLKKTGVAIQYKGLISEDELGEKFSAYNWSKFGFEVKEDASNTYIYDFEKKQPFFEEICNIVDVDGDGILEPYELQRALNNHYIANKLSHLVCKHHNEWAYSGQYLSPLIEELDQFYEKALKKDADGKELENQQELDAIREERKEAFKAKVEQLALWEGIEARKSSYRSKWVNGALVTSPITMGPYLAYKFGKWVYEKMTSEDEPEQEIPLSPFPIANPVVYHFHPVAFVEQMRRMGTVCIINRDFFYENYLAEFGEINDELKNNLEIIFEGIEKYETSKGLAFSEKQVAYILATIKHETGYFKPVIESYWSTEAVRKKYYEDMYDPVLGKNQTRRNMALNNENATEGDGVKYAGKGYVQITWKKNYRKAKEKFGVDFVGSPELALVPKYAIDIALYGFDSGMFTGKTIRDYINIDKCDYYNARRVINGTDAAATIESYAVKFEKCLEIR